MEESALKEHVLLKDSVIKLLGDAKELFTIHFGNAKEDSIRAFEELAEKTRDGRFSIIVVGEFSAGKSTFLNALMREKYLDSFSSETTANINFLKSVNDSPTGKPLIRVNYKDGKTETSDDVSFENIQKYVSTRGIDVATTIDSVEIFLDSPFLNDGVDLVDSPGLNGTQELHADITKSQMKASHAAIFMFRATQPGSKSDFQTLIDLKKSCKSIIVVLNQIDIATKQGEESVEDIVGNLKNDFKKMFPNEKIPEIWPISAYKALVAHSQMPLEYNEKTDHTDEEKKHYLQTSRIEPFENRLMRYITKGEKAKNELLSPVEKVISTINEASDELTIEKDTLEGKFSTDELNNQIDALNTEVKAVKETIAHKKADVENAIYDAIRNAKNSIISDTKELKERTLLDLNNEKSLTDLESNVKLYVARIISRYQSVYSDALSLLDTEFRNAIRRNIDGSIAIINKQLSSVCSAENALTLQTVEIDSSHFNADFDLSKYDKEIAQKQAERKDALEGQYGAEDKQFEAEGIKNKLKSIENSIQSAEKKHAATLAGMQDPGVRIRKEWREREFRTTERSLFNPKRYFSGKWKTEIQQYQEDVHDYTEHNLYKQQKAELEKEHQKRIQELEYRKLQLEEKMSSCMSGSRNARKFQIDKEELEREIEKLQAERNEKLENAIKNQLRKARAYIESIFESWEKENRKQIIQAISEKELHLSQIAMQFLEEEIKEELDTKIKRLESLKEKMTLAEKDKDERIQKIEEARSAMTALLENAEAVRMAIESIETDVIKEQ